MRLLPVDLQDGQFTACRLSFCRVDLHVDMSSFHAHPLCNWSICEIMTRFKGPSASQFVIVEWADLDLRTASRLIERVLRLCRWPACCIGVNAKGGRGGGGTTPMGHCHVASAQVSAV